MERVLHIFDVAPFCHAGAVNKKAHFENLIDTGPRWINQQTPAGGISLLFNSLYYVAADDCVFCCDRNPTIKKSMLSSYKHNRTHSDLITIEKGVAEYVLEKCGGMVLARAGYEADDIIYTIARQQYDNYDRIYIYTGDSDMYFLVNDKVSIRKHCSRGKNVDLYNYEQVLASKNVRYNTMTMSKILDGDSSDCIPGLGGYERQLLAQLFYQELMLPHLGNKEFVMEWVKRVCPQAADQVDLVFPLEVEGLPTEMHGINPAMVCNFGEAMHNNKFYGKGQPGFEVEGYVEEMQSMGYYLEEEN